MNIKQADAHSTKLRTFIPQLRERRNNLVYRGRIGEIGATKSSRYRLVALSAGLSLLVVVLAALVHPALAALVGVGLVLLIAGGWPIATGIAELRQVARIYSHSCIILLAGVASVGVTLLDGSFESLTLLPAIAAVGIVASFIVELGRGEGAIGRLESVISCVSGVLAAVSTAGWVALAGLYQLSHDSFPVLAVGVISALVLGALGIRLISAGPKEGPRRGAVTLGVTPVAFVGVIGYVIAISLTPVLG